tara:strand:- start:495 stop:701 length:207 start_codon:yes stop_codon:yes gene_type:complete
MSEIKKERGTEEILIYALLTEVRYTKEDVDLDVIMGDIIHIMENRKKITKKSIFDAREILTTIRKIKK